jgi:hypothetical protein
MNKQDQLACCKKYKAGTAALYDAFTYALPCTVLEVIEPGNGIFVTSGKLKIRIDEDTGPYKKGEEMLVTGYHTFPRKQRYSSDGQFKINGYYQWVK